MRLLVFSHYFWPEDFRVNELVADLTRRGHQVTVVTGKPNYPSGQFDANYIANPSAYATYHGARIIRVNVIGRGTSLRLILNYLSYAALATLAVVTTLRRERFDAVFVFEPSPFFVGVPATFYRAWRRCPIVFWVLDQWPETLKAVGVVSSERALRWVGKFVSFTYKRCDIILAQSKGLIPVIRQYCHRRQRVEYFPNWAESRFLKTGAADPAPEIPQAEPGTFTVMFAGNIGVAQDLPAVIAAADELKGANVRWVIVGDGRGAEAAKADVVTRGLSNQVVFVGRHPAERMPSFYARADALLVSLRPDPVFAMTIPGKVQSYLMSGVPVLGMLDGEGANAINEAGAGFTGAAGDFRALAANVRRLALLPAADRRAMGASGRAYAECEFDHDTLITKLEQWLTDAAALR